MAGADDRPDTVPGRSTPKLVTCAAALALAMIVAPARGQSPKPVDVEGAGEPPPDATTKLGAWTFSIWARGDHTFTTDIDSGGTFSSSSGRVTLTAESLVQRDLSLKLSMGFGGDFYDFKGANLGSGLDPWDDIYSLGFRGRINWSVTNQWVVFGGADILFSGETGASWDNAITGGGLFGATYIFGQDLQVGLGFFIGSKLEDSVLFVPVPVLHWKIDEHWAISTQGRAGLTGGTGAELIYDFGGGWAAAIGGRYEFRRFRLSDSGPTPNGVGQDSSFPFWARLSYDLNKNFSMDFYGGFLLGGNFQLDDSAGFKLGESDYDGAPFMGLSLRLEY